MTYSWRKIEKKAAEVATLTCGGSTYCRDDIDSKSFASARFNSNLMPQILEP